MFELRNKFVGFSTIDGNSVRSLLSIDRYLYIVPSGFISETFQEDLFLFLFYRHYLFFFDLFVPYSIPSIDYGVYGIHFYIPLFKIFDQFKLNQKT